MQNVTYSDKLKNDLSLKRLVEQATTVLDEVLGQSAPLVSADWDSADDERGRKLVTMRLRDFTGEETARISPRELEDPSNRHIRLSRVWGDLLQSGIRKMLGSMQQRNGGTEE